MADIKISQLPSVLVAESDDSLLMTDLGGSISERINVLDFINTLLPLTTPATELGAEVNDAVNAGSGNSILTGQKVGSQIETKSIAAGTGIGIADSGDTLTISNTISTLLTIITDATTARTLGLTDADAYIRFTSASPVTLTVPTNAVAAFPIGTQIHFVQAGAGAVTVGGAGVTINGELVTNGAFAAATLIKVATDTWDLIGKTTT